MIRNFLKIATTAAVIVALPGIAQAASSSSTGKGIAKFQVIKECSMTGATVNLGSFNVDSTFKDLGEKLGYTAGPETAVGTDGSESVTWGEVNCESGVPYELTVASSTSSEDVTIDIAGKTAQLMPLVKSLGGEAVAVTGAGSANDLGVMANASSGAAAGVSTGTVQAIKGAAPLVFSAAGMTASTSDKLLTAGTFTKSLIYSLTF